MSKVITFSRTYPGYHPRAGEPTYFVEKVLKGLPHTGMEEPDGLSIDLGMMIEADTKHHTIRSGHRWKAGDWFSPRVWSGKPYRSKQIQFAPDIQIKKVWSIQISKKFNETRIWISGGKWYDYKLLATNDGLSVEDMCYWFNKDFEGQIIAWSDTINY